MKFSRIFAVLMVLILLCSCAHTGGEESALQSGEKGSAASEIPEESPPDGEDSEDIKHAPEEFGYVLHNLPKADISAADIAEIAFGFSANYLLTSGGDVYAWGLNDGGCLGLNLPENAMVLSPAKVEIGEPVRQLAVSSGTVVVLGESGALYGWGLNSSACFPNEENAAISSPIKLDTDMEIEHIALSSMLVLCGKNGDVYTCGCFGDEALSFSEQYYATGKIAEVRGLVLVGNVPNIASVSASGECVVLLTENGEVYTIGRIGRHADFDKLGKYANDKITKIDFPEKIMKAEAMAEGLVALSESGKLYYMGHDVYGIEDSRTELAASFADAEKNCITEPKAIEKIGAKVIDFEVGGGNIIVRIENNEFYTWGYNCGSFVSAESADEFVLTPQKIDLPKETNRISISNFSGAALTEDGRAFAWGSGYYCIYMGDTYAKSHTPRELIFGK